MMKFLINLPNNKMKINLPLKLINKVFERDELEIHHINPKVFNGSNEIANLSTLCSICHKHAPDTEKEFKKYLLEKIDSKILNTFRKSDYSISKKTKTGMVNAFKTGRHIAKSPKGYKLIDKLLVPDGNEETISKNSWKILLIVSSFPSGTNNLSISL